ncbi:MAG: hypothetical protein WB723_15290 [Candidatus Acidiferrales bacterium]
MEESVRGQIETQLSHLDGLIQRGRQIRERLRTGTINPVVMAETRAWQEHCGATINQLSGGSKAHWLARSFSNAFLMRTADGRTAEGVPPDEIVKRLVDVLGQAVASLSGMSSSSPLSEASSESPGASSDTGIRRRFEFVHSPELRSVVEQAYADSRQALEQHEYDVALRTSCGVLEAIVTDALEHTGLQALASAGAPSGPIGDWPFETRLAVAEKAGLIRGGCARLPAIARTYRNHSHGDGENDLRGIVSESDARRTGQVLNVVIRDLDPGR